MQLPSLEILASWPAPNYIDPETRGWSNAVVNIVLYPLVCIALGLRVYTRLRISRSFGWDDWLILLSFFPTSAFMVVSLLSEFSLKWNRHVWDVPIPDIVLGLKIIISTQVLFNMGTTLTKCSMLALVYRIVSKTSGIFPKVVIAAIALVAVQGTLFFFMVIFQCRPVSAYWTLSFAPQACIHQSTHLLVAGIINTVTDLLTTLLPLPTVWGLRLPFRQQAIVVLLFAAGLLVTAAGGVRTYYTYRDTVSFDATWNTFAVWLSSSVELYVGTICASLPATKKFFTVYAPKIMGSSVFLRSKQSSPGKSQSTQDDIELGIVDIIQRPDSVANRGKGGSEISISSFITGVANRGKGGSETSLSTFITDGLEARRSRDTIEDIEGFFETLSRGAVRVGSRDSLVIEKSLPPLPK
ncbi:hypothetical protein LSUE1_G005195 [Lachnellula suecica]|uniref:Rhodopsin domain-containing protein n=1 Tax=Lachnellula suecica TaxID=602035 RepID=A0A8T9CIG8_9HELO|nr:hypothetical protein LSUE1_G005195 [Lachnellula suecica]